MIRFYCPDITSSPALPEDESKHCARVLRHVVGDIIEIVDGSGSLFRCRIVDANPKAVRVEIVEKEDIPNPWLGCLTVAIAPTKNADRMEWLVEKLTEIGVDEIIITRCDRSERKELKTRRLERVMVSAMKQSLKTRLPRLRATTLFKDVVTAEYGQKFIAYCDEHIGKQLLSTVLIPDTSTLILIGPEGDFSPAEIADAVASGCRPVSLGPCRLRTETAALVAADTFHIVNQIANKQH